VQCRLMVVLCVLAVTRAEVSPVSAEPPRFSLLAPGIGYATFAVRPVDAEPFSGHAFQLDLAVAPGSGSRGRRPWTRALRARPRVLPRLVYFFSAAFFSAGALDVDFAIDVVGTMMCAYGVPFHITHGPPLLQSVGYASS
jgi:hypothetical protein